MYRLGILKTLWERKKLFVTSNFSFSHNVFFPFFRTFFHFHHIQNFYLQTLSVWKSLKFIVSERVKENVNTKEDNARCQSGFRERNAFFHKMEKLLTEKTIIVIFVFLVNGSLLLSRVLARHQLKVFPVNMETSTCTI